MPKGRGSDRSYKPLTVEHLRRMGHIAALDREAMFKRNPHLAVYRDRILLVALCQGAALHYVDGKNGVKDIDVYTFYVADPKVPYPYRRHGVEDFGESEFGYRPADEYAVAKDFVGRRVDLLGRALKVSIDTNPIEAVKDWMQSPGKTPSLLRQKAVVGIWPRRYLGKVIWT